MKSRIQHSASAKFLGKNLFVLLADIFINLGYGLLWGSGFRVDSWKNVYKIRFRDLIRFGVCGLGLKVSYVAGEVVEVMMGWGPPDTLSG